MYNVLYIEVNIVLHPEQLKRAMSVFMLPNIGAQNILLDIRKKVTEKSDCKSLNFSF